MSEALTTREAQPLALRHELSVDDLVAQVGKVHGLMTRVMKEGEHYGKIPGTDKPTLLKPGAEKLCLLFRLDPQYEVTETRDGLHLTDLSRCTLWHIPTGQRWGSGMGSCSTRESKYAYRNASRTCPNCGSDAIIKGKEHYGGGWLCFAKKGGCGAKFKDGDAKIEDQKVGRILNPDLADTENTVLKMANKRALVAAVLNVTAASDIFTQDLEDTQRDEVIETTAERVPPKSPQRGVVITGQTGVDVSESTLFPQQDEIDERAKLNAEVARLWNKMKWKQDLRQAWIRYKLGAGFDLMTCDIAKLADEVKVLRKEAGE